MMHRWPFRNTPSRGLRSEDGAVTVDWVVLVAVLLPIGFIVGGMIWGDTHDAARRVAEFIGVQTVDDGQ